MDAVICRKMPHERYPRGASGECVWSRSYVGDYRPGCAKSETISLGARNKNCGQQELLRLLDREARVTSCNGLAVWACLQNG